jgi:hypothetical protein
MGLQVEESSGLGASPRLTGGYDGHAVEVSTYTNTYKISRNASSQHRFTQVSLVLSCPVSWKFVLRQDAFIDQAGKRVQIDESAAGSTSPEEEFWISTGPAAPITQMLSHSREIRDALRDLIEHGDILLDDSRLLFRQVGLLVSPEYLDDILQNMGMFADAIEEAQHISSSLS